uniref:Uncharacterized protein n=1 Tax=Arcella intermedia TaxID=1963864 RepID=A0A6B2LST2_9EUKA
MALNGGIQEPSVNGPPSVIQLPAEINGGPTRNNRTEPPSDTAQTHHDIQKAIGHFNT